ncbi:transcription factor Ouib [Drosophila sechellia]|uniref:GM16437 n=2 Tax=Drosophila sechellia TaxID=7238 RepID=B4IJ12_DROSE|nr:transcription factor Ouib [Drosophila sechellia]EDW50965.1 GM16437 [Drosophila sechellia]
MPNRNCRTCGMFIFCSNPSNLFEEPNSVMLHQIEVLTGLFLHGGSGNELPPFICSPCELDLQTAISFRERVIQTQKTLKDSPNLGNADLIESFAVDSEKEIQYAEEVTEIEVIDHLPEEHLLDETEEPYEICEQNKQPQVKIPAQEKKLRGSSKTTPTVFSSVKFADNNQANNRLKPRTHWSRLTEDEAVALKRERRKRDCICEQCGRHFTCPSNFKLHLLRHTGVKRFACDQCSQQFYTATLLRRHQELHAGNALFQCRYCEATYSNASGRIQHERMRHTNVKPFKCKKCNKSFAMSGKLRTHMLSHTGVRAFHCDSCQVSFVRRSHLTSHFRSKSHAHSSSAQTAPGNPVELDVEASNDIQTGANDEAELRKSGS